jgi:hypothetical protein
MGRAADAPSSHTPTTAAWLVPSAQHVSTIPLTAIRPEVSTCFKGYRKSPPISCVFVCLHKSYTCGEPHGMFYAASGCALP